MLTIGWFSTGRGEGSLGLLKDVQYRIDNAEIDTRIEFVFCNREFGESEGSDTFLNQVLDFGIPLISFSSKRFSRENGGGSFSKHRLDFDNHVLSLLNEYKPDICILAGYMLITGPVMCNHYQMLNIHPAPVGGPTGTWQEVIWNLIENRLKESGAYIHLVTEHLDKGPIISYYSFPIIGDKLDELWRSIDGKPIEEIKNIYGESLELFRLIREMGMVRERPLLIETIKALAQGEIQLCQDKVISKQQILEQGFCMNHKVEKSI
jgi:phosphoribosylglycinamide formyltransferase-1